MGSPPSEDGVATKTHVLNVLHRLTDGKGAAAPIDALQAPVLVEEPRADTGRYDALRDQEVRQVARLIVALKAGERAAAAAAQCDAESERQGQRRGLRM